MRNYLNILTLILGTIKNQQDYIKVPEGGVSFA